MGRIQNFKDMDELSDLLDEQDELKVKLEELEQG